MNSWRSIIKQQWATRAFSLRDFTDRRLFKTLFHFSPRPKSNKSARVIQRIVFLTATCRADSEKNEREKLILFINKWFLSLECALQNCQTFLSFGELKSKIECLTVRCFSKKNFRTFTNILAKVTTFSTKTSYLIDVVVYIFDFVISMKKYEIWNP